MARSTVLVCAAFALVALPPGQPAGAAPGDYPVMTWRDEFSGVALDRSRWTFDLGTGAQHGLTGWGNNELQYYTDRPENVAVGDGMLRITARDEDFAGSAYTSARVVSRGLFAQAGGRFEIRAALPLGRGLWPAIWMLPEAGSYGGWAASGEIDIMEARGQHPGRIDGTIHYGGAWPSNVYSGKGYAFPRGQSIADFNTYAVEWDITPTPAIRWYVNDNLFSTQTQWWSSGGGYPAPFDRPFHLLLNLAVGGNYVGSPDASTPFPAAMQVDYVRAYRRQVGEALIDVASGTRPQAMVGYAALGGPVAVRKLGSGTLVLDAVNAHTGTTTISEGTLVVSNTGALAASPLAVQPGGRLVIHDGLIMRSAGLSPAGGLIDVGTGRIEIAPGGTTENALRAALVAGRGTGSFAGASGIVTSGGAAGASGLPAVGYRVMSDGSAAVAWTGFGDASLDGRVSQTDVNLIVSGGKFGQGPSASAAWSQGDFNYSGDVTQADINLLVNAGLFGQGEFRAGAATVQPDGSAPVGVPEPGLLPAAAAMLLAARLRRPPAVRGGARFTALPP